MDGEVAVDRAAGAAPLDAGAAEGRGGELFNVEQLSGLEVGVTCLAAGLDAGQLIETSTVDSSSTGAMTTLPVTSVNLPRTFVSMK